MKEKLKNTAKKSAQPERSVEVITGVTHQKMEAISNISKAVYELSKALNGINATVNISNCHITNSETGIRVGNDD